MSLVAELGMVNANFEYDGDFGVVKVLTHFNKKCEIVCRKEPGDRFVLGGTAINEVDVYEGVLLDPSSGKFRAFKKNNSSFEDFAVLSPEDWQNEADRHCFLHEFYPLDVEGKEPSWIATKNQIRNPKIIFINLDVLDGLGNIIKRYRISPFFGDFKLMEDVCGFNR